ncbi:MAG: acyl-CoA dehydrogenase C-terminal domain-containing protein [Hyphomicrobiales bacterium]|nr:acyl-CoA dehydrogenase C-terminal domain-containing protein [Hyphomicrobiales bacterium]
MTYNAPVADMLFALRHVAGLDRLIADGLAPGLEEDMTPAILEEAAKFAGERLAPLNRIGDQEGATFKGGAVKTAPGFREAYRDWAAAGWNALPGPSEFGGQGLPTLVATACGEMWNSACMAFSLGPLLTFGAMEALHQHGSDKLKEIYLAKLVSGEWMGTMNLTEPQAGSDLSTLRTRAERMGDGTYKITGQKIFITYGDHDLTENIIHLVLARLKDAPPGTRGISLFLVPKFLVKADGSIGEPNDVRCHSIEHKLGIHASPTCTMVYGDKGGATGFLIGEENRGLACMFTMMNNARLNVGAQGVAIAECATQQALAHARERRQGRAPRTKGQETGAKGEQMSPIVEQPDVQRMLLTMRGLTQAARALCYLTAEAIDRAHRSGTSEARLAAFERASILTPIAKAFSTDIGVEVASLGVQVHGGMGFIEETGAAQHLRDARIAPIYEGTNGIQAIDLVTRKLPLSEGQAVLSLIAGMRSTAQKLLGINNPAFGQMAARLREAVEALDRATQYMLGVLSDAPRDALAGATPYLRLFGVAQGTAALAEMALAAQAQLVKGDADPAHAGRIGLARFFAENITTGASGLETTITAGAASVHDTALALAS